jgi:hypothetical protein
MVEHCLKEKSPAIWRKVSEAIHAACESFTDHYNARGIVQDWEDKGRRVVSFERLGHPNEKSTIVISFDARGPLVEWEINGPTIGRCSISADEHEAFLLDGDGDDFRKIMPDELSKKILEPILFA